MAYCLRDTKPFTVFRLIVKWAIRNKLHRNLTQNTTCICKCLENERQFYLGPNVLTGSHNIASTLGPTKNRRDIADDIFKCIFFKGNFDMLILIFACMSFLNQHSNHPIQWSCRITEPVWRQFKAAWVQKQTFNSLAPGTYEKDQIL